MREEEQDSQVVTQANFLAWEARHSKPLAVPDVPPSGAVAAVEARTAAHAKQLEEAGSATAPADAAVLVRWLPHGWSRCADRRLLRRPILTCR